jgi:uncharacterized membrane protein YhaH (DUF805 family)
MKNSDSSCCDSSGACSSGCKCVCHKMLGFLVALIGLVLLLGKLDIITQRLVDLSWPTLLILAGLKKAMGKGPCKCCK